MSAFGGFDGRSDLPKKWLFFNLAGGWHGLGESLFDSPRPCSTCDGCLPVDRGWSVPAWPSLREGHATRQRPRR